jgi:hypothetical protein
VFAFLLAVAFFVSGIVVCANGLQERRADGPSDGIVQLVIGVLLLVLCCAVIGATILGNNLVDTPRRDREPFDQETPLTMHAVPVRSTFATLT